MNKSLEEDDMVLGRVNSQGGINTARSQEYQNMLGDDSIHSVNRFYDDTTIGKYSVIDNNMQLGLVGERKIDKLNQYALQNWKKEGRRKRRPKNKPKAQPQEEVDDYNDLKKIVKLYKIYGNDQLALVNPAENPGILQVRKRSAERRRIEQQMGLG